MKLTETKKINFCHRIVLNLFLLLSFVLPAFEFARAETLEVKDIAIAIPQNLIAHGITKVGTLELQPIVNEIATKVKWGLLPVFSIGAGTNGSRRSGSSCRMKEQTVYINQPHLENLKHIELIRGLLFHEALCAIGWNDDNYMISSSLGAIDRMIRAAQGNSTELSKIHSFLKYPNFLTAFRVQLARHTDNQRFQSPGNLMLADGGSVTGVGGGGDGFGWYLKSLLFDNFYSFYSICSKAKSTSTIPYPGLKSELNKFELYLNCSEPQLYTWWSYFLSLSIETGYFRQGDASILTVAEFPWMGSIIIEEMQKPKSRFDHSKIKLTFNSLRWMAFDADEWVRTGSGVFLTLITKYYPLYPMSVAASPASATEVNPFHQTSNSKLLNPVLEVRGEQTYVENYFKIYKYAAIKRCTRERTRADSDLSFSYNPVSTEEYLRQRSAISEADLTKPPHCAVVLD